jgi:quinoprotein dehydrogenase-associated probable ABC transporter substrate-binding protein
VKFSAFPRQCGAVRWAAVAVAVLLGAARAEQDHLQRELVVCADRENLPFSNEQAQGFENKIARVIAEDLHVRLRYAWNPPPRGFRPRLLKEGRCDLVMGVPAGLPGVAVTQPYYVSSYVLVTARRRGFAVSGFDDPKLTTLKIGLEAVGAEGVNTPPARALARRGITQNIVGYSMWSHPSERGSRAHMVDAVVKGEIDAALMWGPFAGYYGKSYRDQVVLMPLLSDPQQPSLPFTYAISLGVRQGNDALLAEVTDALRRKQPEIKSILQDYGIPLVETRGHGASSVAQAPADQFSTK